MNSRYFLFLFVSGFAGLAQCATDPSVLQDYRDIPNAVERFDTPSAPDIPVAASPAAPSAESNKIRVEQFSIEGASIFDTTVLHNLIRELEGQALSITDIHAASARISRFYHEAGYPLVTTFLPPQNVENGVVKLVIVEGKLGQVQVAGSARLPETTVAKILSAQGLSSGTPITRDALERSLIMLQNMPATDATLSLKSGTETGTSDILVNAQAKNLLSGQLSVDNHAPRYIGAERVTARLALNSPWGWGDQWDLRLTHAQDHDFSSVAYSLPIGYQGLRLGVGASRLDYDLCCDLSYLDWNGEMTTYSANASYPLILSAKYKLYLGGSYFRRTLRDNALDLELSDRTVRASQIYLNGALSGQSEIRFNVGITRGDLDLSDNADYKAADAAAAETRGEFWKLRAAMQQHWSLPMNSWLDTRISGQWASKNLDVSEKFLIGGVDGVRAYPVGEAAGDRGLLGRVELGTRLPSKLPGKIGVALFLDVARTWLNEDRWAGALRSGQSNRFSLAGTGISATWLLPNGVSAEVSVATKLGDNNGRYLQGEDSDGRDLRTRGWAALRWDY